MPRFLRSATRSSIGKWPARSRTASRMARRAEVSRSPRDARWLSKRTSACSVGGSSRETARRRSVAVAVRLRLIAGQATRRGRACQDSPRCSVSTAATQAHKHGEGPAGEQARQLKQAIDEIVARTPLHAARASILVAALDSGQVLYARDPDALLNPASNVKLFTSAAALARLGPEYRFETEVLVDSAPSGGAVKGLFVRGKGDPTFVTERLWALAGEIAHRGVT